MTSAADPHDFSTMEITIQAPSKNGALAGTVILSGRTFVTADSLRGQAMT